MTVRNVKKNLAGQQDLLPGVGPYEQIRRGQAVTVDGPAKSYFELWIRSYAEVGLPVKGMFEDGATLTAADDIAVHLVGGVAYSWDGSFPKVVPAGSTPETTGGIGSGAWVDRTDVTLRSELAADGGADLIGRAGGTVSDVMPKKGDVTIAVPVDYPSLMAALESISDWRFPEHTVTIHVSGETVATAPAVVSHVDAERLHIVGDDLIALSASSVTISTYATPTTTVSMTLTDTSSVDVGDWLYIYGAQGTGPYKLIEGCWKVSSKVGNVITYDVRSWAKVPDGITITSVLVEKFVSVLRFNNCDGVVTRSRLGLLDKVAVIGNSDDYWLSSNVSGTEKGTHGIYAGGLSVVVNTWNDPAQGCASITLGERVGVNGFDQQGIVCDQSSSIFAYHAASCNNKRRGFYSAGGKIRNKFAIANGNYWDGMISDYGSIIESSNVTCAGNRVSGALAFNGGNLSAPSSSFQCNSVNAQARKGGVLDAQISVFTDALTRDVLSDAGGNVVVDSSTFESINESIRSTAWSYVQALNSIFPDGAVHINAQQSYVLHSGSNATSITSVDSVVRSNDDYNEYRHSGPVTVPDYLYCSSQFRVRHKTATTEHAKITPTSIGDVVIGSATKNSLTLKKNGDSVLPALGDNLTSFGLTSARWSVIYAGTGEINTSDAREKSQPLAIDDAVLDAWGDVQFITFQWLSSIIQKGESARWHFGVIAQQVRDAFLSHGIDGTRYGFLCYDEWDASDEVTDEEGGVVTLAVAAGNRWGIRPDQCLFLEAAFQRRNYARLLERVLLLESK